MSSCATPASADPLVSPSDARLCDLFQMLIERLDTVETSVAALAAKAEDAAAARRMAADYAPQGSVFSTAELLGRRVASLPRSVCKHFKAGNRPNVIAVSVGLDCVFSVDSPEWAAGEEVSHIDDDLREAFGAEELTRIKRACTEFYALHPYGRNSPTPADVGIQSKYDTLNHMLLATAARRRVSGLVALSTEASFFRIDADSPTGALESVVQRAAQLADVLGWSTTSQELDVYSIHPGAVHLAVCQARGDAVGAAQAWRRMQPWLREALQQDMQQDNNFFGICGLPEEVNNGGP